MDRFNGNKFLESFVRMRAGLNKANASVVTSATTRAAPAPPRGLPTREVTLEVLCETKPKPKVVKEFFEKRVAELTAE